MDHTFLDSLFGQRIPCKSCKKLFLAGVPDGGDVAPPQEPVAHLDETLEKAVIVEDDELPIPRIRKSRRDVGDDEPCNARWRGSAARGSKSSSGVLLGVILGIAIPLMIAGVVLIVLFARQAEPAIRKEMPPPAIDNDAPRIGQPPEGAEK